MPKDDKTGHWDDSQPEPVADPLGVIGWLIGGKYKVKSYIGGGGFGEVYDGYNINLTEQKLVIKFFKRVAARDKFEKEAKILCMLDHPNISRVIDFLPEEGALVVAFINGTDGGQILKDKGPLSEELFLKVASSMTSALAYAHSKKIAHRDIKPDNILIDQNEHVYLIDFGIAKVMRENATKTAYQALTPMFAAPERQTGESNYNPFLSDVYEIGVTLFNFLTNEMPYRNPANPNIREWGGPAAKVISSHLRKILFKATQPDPTQRYQSVAELHKELEGVKEVYKRSGGVGKYIGIAAAVVVLAAAGLYFTGIMSGNKGTEQVQQPVVKNEAIQPTVTPSQTVNQPVTQAEDSAEGTPAETNQTPNDNQSAQTTEIEKAPEQEPEVVEQTPPPPALPSLRVSVVPEYNVSLYLDGAARSQNRAYELKKGKHEITIIQPDYPIYTENIDLQVDKSLRINLGDVFAANREIYFNIGISPSDFEDAGLTVNFNGGAVTFASDNIPITDLKKLAGKWQIGFDIKAPSGSSFSNAKIDSFVTFPYGGGPRVEINGSKGLIDFSQTRWESLETIGILVYWSK